MVGKGIARSFLILIGWIHALIEPIGEWFSVSVLGTFEELTKSVVRGWFATGGRYTHQFAAFIISVFSRKRYSRSQKRKAAARKVAWENWWRDPKGTFNAIVEQELGNPSQKENNEENTAPLSPPPLPLRVKLNNGPQHSNTAAATANTKPPARKFWRRTSSEQELNFLNRGSILFGNPAASPLMQAGARRGLLEDTRLAVEVGIARIFGYIRKIIRKVFFLENPIPLSPRLQHLTSKKTFHGRSGSSSGGGFSTARRTSTRHNPGKAWESLHVFTASDAILRAGYPLEEHSITTSDGYVLQMHRIPRRGARDVVFMVHGVLDTSLGWVVGGTGGSAALEAYDAGFDVWLANTRSNPPRLNTNSDKKGSRYWQYSANELAMCDVTAQVDHIHAAKVAELAAPGMAAGKADRKSYDGDAGRDGDSKRGMSRARSATESCLAGGEMKNVDNIPEFTTDSKIEKNGISNDEIGSMVKDNYSDQTGPVLRRTQSAGPEDRPDALPGWDISQSGVEDENGSGISRKSTPTHAFSKSSAEVLPYRLQAVGHSLGAAQLLMYVVGSSMNNQPHRIRRLILLSPAGFHSSIPLVVRPFKWLVPLSTKLCNFLRPGCGLGLRLPSPVLRWFTFKLLADVNRSPALLDLMKAGLSVATSGDTSEWTAAISLPHYAPQSMPALSLHSANHFAQWARDGNFRFYDYGSALKNQAHYGEDNTKPPSVAENYWRLSDMPVDLAAGSSDGLIPPENVKCHLEKLQAARVKCTLRQFEYGHLDFIFGVKEEVNGYILHRLRKSAWGGRDS